MPTSATDKSTLRRHLLATRRALDPAVRAHADLAIGLHVERWCQQHQPKSLGVYWPISAEPDLRATYAVLAAQGMPLALPLVVARDAPLQFAAWDRDTVLVKDAFGVMVPQAPHLVALPQALLIPCVGFNADGYRIGYGGGFYDRTLACQPRPQTIGIAYACLHAPFEADPHDMPLDIILTERA